MRNWKSSGQSWAITSPNSVEADPTIPDLWEAPTIEQLMEPDAPVRSPQPELPSWIPSTPILPVPNGPPIEVDPPSRPPQWLFGPPKIAQQMLSGPRFPLMALFAADPSKALQDWASSRSSPPASTPSSGPSIAAPVAAPGSMADLLMDYIQRQRQRSGS
jgi:hypothetical protein